MGKDRLCGARGQQNPGELAHLERGRCLHPGFTAFTCRTCDLTSLTFSFHICKTGITIILHKIRDRKCLVAQSRYQISNDWVWFFFFPPSILIFIFYLLGCVESLMLHVGSLIILVAREISFPDQGSNPGLLHWELGVLATGPPGMSLFLFLF